MFAVTGPVTTRPSAWRGEATNWIPNRPRSKTTVPSTFRSASAELSPPADTCPQIHVRRYGRDRHEPDEHPGLLAAECRQADGLGGQGPGEREPPHHRP